MEQENQDFAQELQEEDKEEIQEIEVDEEQPIEPKKFVFKVNPEYVEYVDNLSVEEKTDLINYLLHKFMYEEKKLEKKEKVVKVLKDIFVTLFIAILLIPFVLMIVNFSLNSTQANYKYMQSNFEKLFER